MVKNLSDEIEWMIWSIEEALGMIEDEDEATIQEMVQQKADLVKFQETGEVPVWFEQAAEEARKFRKSLGYK